MSQQFSDAQQSCANSRVERECLTSVLDTGTWSREGEEHLVSNEVVGHGFRAWLEYYPDHDAVQVRLESSTTLTLESVRELRAALKDLLTVNADLRRKLTMASKASV